MSGHYGNKNITTCFSTHLTNFAVIFSGEITLNEQDKKALTYLTLIGLGISTLGASLTILTYLTFPYVT